MEVVQLADTVNDEKQGNQPTQPQPPATPDNSSTSTALNEHSSLPPTNEQNWTLASVANTPASIDNT